MKNAPDRNKLCYLYDVEGKTDVELTCQEIPNNISDFKKLHISTLAMDFPESVSKKHRDELENKWIELLPKLDNITSLSIRHRVNQEYFEAICKMKNLKTLFFWTSTVQNINSISKLSNLSSLSLQSFSKLKDVSALKKLNKLRRLTIENCFQVENYETIGDITELTGLCIGGDFSAPKNLILHSLVPFKRLNQLKHLDMSTTSIRDKSYDVILEMKNLERLDAHWRMPDRKRTELKEKHPNLKAGFFVDYNFVKNEFYEGKKW
ncbi:hypothetical protein [Cellulophaga omnivescoria]|uniref:hypothetical protein n=1 Tax=Cellulophaga omnivescoria TaxID=1888890 RepID=UPI0022F01039|nr:hypothetical protein [Cellulophaga omnivescoria]WBU89759.1 hypothetical protein PBN93_01780 [Cellulophaga omnivescoria]WKB81881.1 hypothetical protein QYR09_02315 [Cellulophaga lytica]